MHNLNHQLLRKLLTGIVLFCGLILIITGGIRYASAKYSGSPLEQDFSFHPSFMLLDENNVNVLESNMPISTMNTCGACHDVDFIVEHSFHVQLGLDEFTNPGSLDNGHTWDTSPGAFGKWNPLGYRYLSPIDDERIDLTTPEWIMTLGLRHTGGGPSYFSRDGRPLMLLRPDANNPETAIHDPETGDLIAWDWRDSGTIEMNCFLCHLSSPNNTARKDAIMNGYFGWANTATMIGSGLVTGKADQYVWNPEAFDENGEILAKYVQIQDPDNSNCGLCHGLVHDVLEEPIVISGCSPERYTTITTGQIITGQHPKDSGLNLFNKNSLDRSWDIHAERLLECTDCHYSLNNPVYYRENAATQPDHLEFDPRRLEIGEYLYQPLHQFARGQSAQGSIVPELVDTMRRCESCHSIDNTHDWLPYKEQHTAAISCESCHIPQIYSSAARQFDWTVVTLDGTAQSQCRGIEGEEMSLEALVYGYEPLLMPRLDIDGNLKLSPYNVITYYYWVYGDPERPVPLHDLQAVWLEGSRYQDDILTAFDTNADSMLSSSELVIDTEEKENLIANKLQAIGLDNAHIIGEIQPYSINHDVATGDWALRDCQLCHGEQSRITQPILLSSYSPMGIQPAFITETNVVTNGKVYTNDIGEVYYQPSTSASGLYVLGLDNVDWIDLYGGILFTAVLAAVLGHSTLRYINNKRRPKSRKRTDQVYMYEAYERLWHWLQTVGIVILLFTGLVIHKPDMFGFINFRIVIVVHNVIAAILAANAVFALFYHLVSGKIKQYIPQPKGFFSQAIAQTMFYLRGIYRNESHPFEKTPLKKLNPLQQLTYFAILNVLLPLQGITGILIWGAQRWPDLVMKAGGLTFLSPLHTILAWTFASFIVGHVYLTTTGSTPLAGIKAMITGWEVVESHRPKRDRKNQQ